jgi:hypothetical protein
MKTMKTLTTCAAILFTLAASAQTVRAAGGRHEPARDGQAAQGLTGKWSMSLEGPQGPMTLGLVLNQQGTKVTGTLAGPQGDAPLEGQFVDGTLTFGISVESPNGSMQLSFSGKLKDDGSLEGTLSGPMGEIPWKAVRVKD